MQAQFLLCSAGSSPHRRTSTIALCENRSKDVFIRKGLELHAPPTRHMFVSRILTIHPYDDLTPPSSATVRGLTSWGVLEVLKKAVALRTAS
jgi:hypothetical protein